MIRHVVMWKLVEHAGGADKAAHMATMKRLLEGCRGLVPGMGAFEVGLAAPGLEATCDVVLVSEFGSAAALEACQRHPQHLAIRPFIGAVHAERQGVDDEV